MKQSSFFLDVLAQLRAVPHCDLPRVASQSGVPESTLRKIRYGEVKDPRVLTVQALHNYFQLVGAQTTLALDLSTLPTSGPRSRALVEAEIPHG